MASHYVQSMTTSFLVLLWFVSFVKGTDLPQCQYEVINKTLDQELFFLNDTIPVPSVALALEFESDEPETFCSVDIMHHLSTNTRHNYTEVIIFVFGSRRKQNVVFTNLSAVKSYFEEFSIIGYLIIINCGTPVHNIRNVIAALQIRVAFLKNIFYHDNYTYADDEFDHGGCKGIGSIASLVVDNITSPNEFISDLHLCNSSFPQMAEVTFTNIFVHNLSNFIESMYPNLQSAELSENKLTELPGFRFTDENITLPNNLYRTHNFQASYIGVVQYDVPRNVFKRTIELSKNEISSIPRFAFDGPLQVINLRENIITSVADTSFWKVTNLQVLRMNKNRITIVPKLLLANQTSLQYFDIASNFIKSLHPKFFAFTPRLKFVDLSYNSLTALPEGLFKFTKNLQFLRLSFNRIELVPSDMLPNLNSPLQPYMQNNTLFSLPKRIFYSRKLREIRLSTNNIPWISLSSMVQSVDITTFANDNDLTGSFISGIKSHYDRRDLDMSNNSIEVLSVENNANNANKYSTFLYLLLSYYDVTLTGNPIQCDCNIVSLVSIVKKLIEHKSLDKDISTKRKWICSKPNELAGEKVLDLIDKQDNLYCPVSIAKCPTRCICYQRLVSASIIVSCEGRYFENMPPEVPSIEVEIRLSENNLTSLSIIEYLKNVSYLDVSRNNLRTIDSRVFLVMTKLTYLDISYNLLTSLPDTLARLPLITANISRNPYRCDCHTKWMKKWLVRNLDIVKNGYDTSCSTEDRSGRRILHVEDNEFVCRTTQKEYLWIYITIPASLSLFMVLISLIIFRHSVKVLLFYHFGIDCSCKTVSECYRYDVFVLYPRCLCQFVEKEIKPVIERDENIKLIYIWSAMCAGHSIAENVRYFSKLSSKILYIIDWENREEIKSYIELTWVACQDMLENGRASDLILLSKNIHLMDDEHHQIQAFAKTGQHIIHEKKLFVQTLACRLFTGKNYQISNERTDCVALNNEAEFRNVPISVFLIYAEEDREYVINDVLPIMDKIQVVCIHEDDFYPGKPRLESIHSTMESVDHLLMVISQANVNDQELGHVFRLAFDRSITMRTNYLLVVRKGGLGGVDDKSLDSYLKSYVCMDTNEVLETKLCEAIKMTRLEE